MKLILSNRYRFSSVAFRHRTRKGDSIRVARLLRASAARSAKKGSLPEDIDSYLIAGINHATNGTKRKR